MSAFDRHLFGLRLMAKELGMADPDLYADVGWKRSGGDGNFVLSTSFTGYSNVWGGAVPMCLHGYGIFYKIQNHRYSRPNETGSCNKCDCVISEYRSL